MGIKQVGIELEGLWNNKPDNFTYDGSVTIQRPTGREWVGEVPSPPLTIPEVNPWLEANYPDMVNHTCGMHVHISFDTKTEYSLLMTHADQLELDLITNVRAWAEQREIIPNHPLWDRLAGGNQYCRPGTENTSIQARLRSKRSQRYKMLNFCYSLHGTLEIRLLPGFKRKHLGIEAVNVVISTVHSALENRTSNYSGIPKEITRETSVGMIECHAWKQGFTCFLDTSASVKAQIYEKVYGRQKVQTTLARLLKRDRVTFPVMTLDNLESELTRAALTLNQFEVTLTRNET